MYLTPENAPVGAVVVIRLRGHVKLVEISGWNGEKVWIRWEGEFFGAEVGFISRLDQPEPVKPSPGDSVTIERDRDAMDALRRLAAVALEQSTVADGAGVESLEQAVKGQLNRGILAMQLRDRIAEAAITHGWKDGDLIRWLASELSALREFRRASERLPGEGDVVEWTLVDSWAYAYLHDAIAIQSGVWWYLATRGDHKCMTFPSVIEPHPDLHPVRVDGVWRWVRKEKV